MPAPRTDRLSLLFFIDNKYPLKLVIFHVKYSTIDDHEMMRLLAKSEY
jgi:hypothetical protein